MVMEVKVVWVDFWQSPRKLIFSISNFVLGIEKHTVSNFRCSFETVCFSIPNTFPVAQKSFQTLCRFLLDTIYTSSCSRLSPSLFWRYRRASLAVIVSGCCRGMGCDGFYARPVMRCNCRALTATGWFLWPRWIAGLQRQFWIVALSPAAAQRKGDTKVNEWFFFLNRKRKGEGRRGECKRKW